MTILESAGEHALESLHTTAMEIFRGALEDCRIDSAFDRHIRFEGTQLHRPVAQRGEQSVIDLKDFKRVFVVSIGKAAASMLDTLLTRMPRRKGVRGICCSSSIPERRNWRIRYFEGGHPLPSEGSFAAARAALALLKKAKKDTLVIFLISGGASALFDLPLDPDISLEDTMSFHQALIGSGAPITEINVIRKHFSAVKGGRLAITAEDATKLSILLPDVPLRRLDVLASGPTYPDHSTLEEARNLIAQYNLRSKFPDSINAFFDRADAHNEAPESADKKRRAAAFLPRMAWPDTFASALKKVAPASAASVFGISVPGPASPGPISTTAATPSEPSEIGESYFRKSNYEVLLSSNDLVENARIRALSAGYHAIVDNSCDDWDYADAARYLLERFHFWRAQDPKICLISGGEVTVTLDRPPGAGGRNQQFALACALDLANFPGQYLAAFSAGSDGIDGNTRAAGAISDTSTVSRATAFGYDPEEALAAFNACPLFTALGDTVPTGPTGHNLRDLRLLLSTPE